MRWVKVVQTRSLWVQVEEAEVEDSETCQHTYEVAVANEEPEAETAVVEVYAPHDPRTGWPDVTLDGEPLDLEYEIEVTP